MVADVGCGHGASTMLMAQAFPNSEFVGIDFHDASIDHARRHADGIGNARFEVARAQDFGGSGYDLVTMFDALHDMGDPVGAVAHIRETLKSDGTLMLVEPMAGDSLAEKSEPGRTRLLCRVDPYLRSDLAEPGNRRGLRGAGGREAP
jgi:trans-aconitate methyltransferase